MPLAELVASYLQREHFEVTVCHTGVEALSVARDVDPDVVVLDLGLPGIDGVELCRQLRTFSDAYVVMLTARDTEIDTIVGLSVGADDYVTKPFSPRELVARIRAMLRRPRTASVPAFPSGQPNPDDAAAPGVRTAVHRHRQPAGVPRRRTSGLDAHRVRHSRRAVVTPWHGMDPPPTD